MSLRQFHLSAVAAASAVTIGQTVQAAGYIGMNLERFADYTDSRVFTDIVMTARSFAPTGSPYVFAGSSVSNPTLAAVRADGWPSGDFALCVGDDLNIYTSGVGTYEGSYTGSSITTSITGSGCTVQNHRSVGGGVYRFEVVLSGSKSPYVAFAGLPADFSGLRIIRPGYAWDTAKLFTDEWLTSLSPYSLVRTMNTTRTSVPKGIGAEIYSSEGQTTWASRWTDASTPAGKIWRRHTWETVAQIANTTGKDIWVCIPLRATDDYIAGMFSLLHSLINPGIKIYVEYSNEVWNTQQAFQPQFQYCQAQARTELGLFGGSTLASDISSATVASNVVTVNFARPHGKTTGQTIYAKMGSSGSLVPAGLYAVTVPTASQLTFSITGGVDGPINMTTSATNTLVIANPSSDLAFDFLRGSVSAEGAYWMPMQNEYYWGYRFAARRLAQAKDILAGIDTSLIKTRFHFVVAGQFASSAVFGQAWLLYLARYHSPLLSWISAVSGAPYTSSNGTDTTVDQVIATMEASRLTQKARYQQWVVMAKSIGAEFIPYEIGTDLFVRAAGNATLADSAGNDTRISAVVREMLLDSARYGAKVSNFYSFGAGHTGSGFLLKKSFTSTEANDPRYAGVVQALGSQVPTLATTLTATAVPESSASPDMQASGYAMYGPDMFGGISGGSGNLIFGGNTFGGAVKQRFTYVHYVTADGQWDLNWQLGTNNNSAVLSLFVDGVDTGIDITPNLFASVDNTPCTDITPARLTLTKGWHVFKVEINAASVARLGARQFKLTPA